MSWIAKIREWIDGPVVDVRVPPPFQAFKSIPRWSRDIIITEKIDGTNALVYVGEDGEVLAGSRNRWLAPGKQTDNHGFAVWVLEHEDELRQLGPGYHYGEWWGNKIGRGYGLKSGDKRFSLFNVTRWNPWNGSIGEAPKCCGVVPKLYEGPMGEGAINGTLTHLQVNGSYASPGYMKPEGIVIYHTAGNVMFKKTLEHDAKGKPE